MRIGKNLDNPRRIMDIDDSQLVPTMGYPDVPKIVTKRTAFWTGTYYELYQQDSASDRLAKEKSALFWYKKYFSQYFTVPDVQENKKVFTIVKSDNTKCTPINLIALVCAMMAKGDFTDTDSIICDNKTLYKLRHGISESIGYFENLGMAIRLFYLVYTRCQNMVDHEQPVTITQLQALQNVFKNLSSSDGGNLARVNMLLSHFCRTDKQLHSMQTDNLLIPHMLSHYTIAAQNVKSDENIVIADNEFAFLFLCFYCNEPSLVFAQSIPKNNVNVRYIWRLFMLCQENPNWKKMFINFIQNEYSKKSRS